MSIRKNSLSSASSDFNLLDSSLLTSNSYLKIKCLLKLQNNSLDIKNLYDFGDELGQGAYGVVRIVNRKGLD